MLKHFVLAVSLSVFVAQARADVVIGFDGPTGSLPPYSEDGFTLTPIPGALLFNVSTNGGNPVPRLDTDTFQIAATNGSSFNLISLDYALGDGSTDDWRVEGFFAGSGSIVQLITQPAGWKTATFTGFTGLSSVEITPTVSGGALSWDNIRVAAIPEPSAFALLGLIGLVASGRSWWKRRRLQVGGNW